jgi:SAM-dependent methyltransferase
MTARPLPSERKTPAWWDEFWRRPPGSDGRSTTHRRTAEVALALLDPELRRSSASRFRLLDLGCGTGDITWHLWERPGLEVVALDFSAEALSQAARLVIGPEPRPFHLVRGDAYCLPFGDGAFDAVVSFGYASAASYPGVETEVARLLRPGGVAVVDFANPSLYHWLADPRGTLRWYRRYRDPSSGQYHFGRRGVPRHFRPAGLVLETVRYLNAYPPLATVAKLPGCAALDRGLARAFGQTLGRVMVVKLRRLR